MKQAQGQGGFTLIELIVVIVILGILAATALPRFFDLRSDAVQAAVNGVAGALSSSSTINYSARLANSNNGSQIASCAAVSGLLQGGLPAGYSVGGGAVPTSGTANVVTGCVVTGAQGTISYTANFTAIGIS